MDWLYQNIGWIITIVFAVVVTAAISRRGNSKLPPRNVGETTDKQQVSNPSTRVTNSQAGVIGDHAHIDGGITFQNIDRYIQQAVQKDDADPSEILRLYCGVLIRSFKDLPLRGVDLGVCDPAEEQRRLQLDQVYVELDTTTQVEVTKAEKKKDSDNFPVFSDKTLPLSAMNAALGNQCMVLLGDPGSGKSTYINYLTLCLALHGFDSEAFPLKNLSCWPEKNIQWVPIPVVLRDFAASLAKTTTGAEVKYLWDFILNRLSSQKLDFAKGALEDALENGNAILLLDGLDEVPTRELRAFVRDTVDKFRERYDQCRYLVTCRVLSYQDPKWRLDPAIFPIFELAPFDQNKIDAFIEAWYGDLERLNVVDTPEKAARMAGRLKEAVRRSDLRRLAPNPLLLTVMALVHTHKGRLPDARALLYEETVDILLWRWEQVKATGETTVSRLQDLLLEADRADVDLKRILWKLAFHAHAKTGEGDDETPVDIQEPELRMGLASLHPDESLAWADRIIQTIKLRAGLLLERQPGVYAFPHRTFQEYLAGAYLSSQADFAKKAAELMEEGNFWREVVLLAVGRLIYITVDTDKPLALAGELCPTEEPKDQTGWRKVWIAGEVLVEIGTNRLKDRNLGKDLKCRVGAWLVKLMEGGHLENKERASAGNALARLGDPRFNPNLFFLPDDDHLGFVRIPAGEFLMGSDRNKDKDADDAEFPQHTIELSEYWINRYPVTVAQFRVYVKASGQRTEVEDRLRGIGNHPVVLVSLHEAAAYCEWLTKALKAKASAPEPVVSLLRQGWVISLPSEAQWEKAARGTDGRIYPWGSMAYAHNANYDETGIGGTSPVGCFQSGMTQYGLLDMAGNVWEWTCSSWGADSRKSYYKYPYDSFDGREDEPTKTFQVIRGGSWQRSSKSCRVACRGMSPFRGSGSLGGFRLALRPGRQVGKHGAQGDGGRGR